MKIVALILTSAVLATASLTAASYSNQGYDNRGYDNSSTYYNNDPRDNQFQGNSQMDPSQTSPGMRDTSTRDKYSDQTITKKVQDVLKGGLFSKGYKNVEFAVQNGNVTLTGSVDDQSQKQDVQDKVMKIDGVQHVDNQIVVVPEGK